MEARPLQTLPEIGAQENHLEVVVRNEYGPSNKKPFIEAGTVEASLEEIKKRHIIPVFHRDNEPVISQVDFIQTTMDVVQAAFPAERILSPSIRLSHAIKGRVPEAKDKPASELYEWEKTLYYERMAFIIEVASISDSIDGQSFSLTIGGVKAHHLDNLYSRRGTEQHFKLFIGFQVHCCTNLSVWSDGFAGNVKVKSLAELKSGIHSLVTNYDAISSLSKMSALQHYTLTEKQFAQLIGRCRLYQHLPTSQKREIPELLFGDSHINAVARDYYKDNSFCRNEQGEISLWRLYNLLTTANKNSYIDQFLERSVNASELASSLASALEKENTHWFLG